MGCRRIKAVRELVQNVVRTDRSPIPARGVGYLRGAVLSTRGPGWTGRWCIVLYYQMHGRVAKPGRDKR